MRPKHPKLLSAWMVPKTTGRPRLGAHDLPASRLFQCATVRSHAGGRTAPRDTRLFDEDVRFAARSTPTADLTHEEGAELKAFIAVLGKRN